jgi:hypothetical protein
MSVDAQCHASNEVAIGLRPKKAGDSTTSAGSDHPKRKICETLFSSNIRVGVSGRLETLKPSDR